MDTKAAHDALIEAGIGLDVYEDDAAADIWFEMLLNNHNDFIVDNLPDWIATTTKDEVEALCRDAALGAHRL